MAYRYIVLVAEAHAHEYVCYGSQSTLQLGKKSESSCIVTIDNASDMRCDVTSLNCIYAQTKRIMQRLIGVSEQKHDL